MRMSKKVTRSKRQKDEFQYSAEDLRPKDPVADDEFIDKFIERNREALGRSLQETESQFTRGDVYTPEEVMAEIDAQRKRRRVSRRRR